MPEMAHGSSPIVREPLAKIGEERYKMLSSQGHGIAFGPPFTEAARTNYWVS